MSDAALTVEARIPASLAAAVAAKLRAASAERVPQRLRDADATLWGPPGAPEIADRLGWLDIAERMLGTVQELRTFAAAVREDGLRDVVLLGMGGSSLAPEVLRRCFGGARGHPRVYVLDSTDAGAVRAVGEAVQPASTLFLVSSKSGGTIEPLSLFAHFWSLVGEGTNFAAITDPGTGLEELAHTHRFRHVFHGDPHIGGRYSALSAFGMVPAALMGVDVAALLEGAPRAWDSHVRPPQSDRGQMATGAGGGASELAEHAGVWVGAALSALTHAGRDKLTFLISSSLPGLGLWLEQLVAESTGKQETGILPIAEEPPGAPGEYGPDRVFAHVYDVDAPEDELAQRARALADAGHPLLAIPTRGPGDLGRVFLLWEIAVAAAGWGLGINPFDQPNVQQAKDATKRVLAEFEARHELPEPREAGASEAAALLRGAAPPQYVAIMGYVQPSDAFDAAVARLRATVRSQGSATTTFGYGPRFLHSTGQFHKGGPRTGRFLALLHDSPPDVEIPGAPYTFTTLKNAQAIGDQSTLEELGLPVARVRLRGEDPAQALDELRVQMGMPDADTKRPAAQRVPEEMSPGTAGPVDTA